MRALILLLVLAAVPLATVSAQPTSPPPPTITITSPNGDLSSAHEVIVKNLPPGAALLVLFDPHGNQQVLNPVADASGTVDTTLTPPDGGWEEGVYRLAVGLQDGKSISATFTAGDGAPHLYVAPASPSPTSAFNFIGTGLPAGTQVTVHFWPTGGHLPQLDLHPTTDANGTFSIYVWPGELGAPFFPAGVYRVDMPAFDLSVSFETREHPVSAAISADQPVVLGDPASVHFVFYQGGRYLWGVYADANGAVGGEFLIGPTDPSGALDAKLILPDLGPGPYYIATPYDWGETSLQVVEPTATATATAIRTATPRPKPKHTKKCCVGKRTCKGKHGKKHKRCKR